MWLYFKEAVAIVSGLGLIFYIPLNTRRIVGGWVPAKYTGDATDYPAFYVRRATRFMWFGIVIGGVVLALVPLGDGAGEWIPDMIIAAIWFVIAAMTYRARHQISAAQT